MYFVAKVPNAKRVLMEEHNFIEDTVKVFNRFYRIGVIDECPDVVGVECKYPPMSTDRVQWQVVPAQDTK